MLHAVRRAIDKAEVMGFNFRPLSDTLIIFCREFERASFAVDVR